MVRPLQKGKRGQANYVCLPPVVSYRLACEKSPHQDCNILRTAS